MTTPQLTAYEQRNDDISQPMAYKQIPTFLWQTTKPNDGTYDYNRTPTKPYSLFDGEDSIQFFPLDKQGDVDNIMTWINSL